MEATKYRGIVKLGTNKHLIRLRVTCPRTGKRKAVVREVECTLTEARALQLEWRGGLTASLQSDPTPRLRLRDFAPSWLRGRIEAGELKRSSADKIALVWDLHIVTHDISCLYIDDIRDEDVRGWLEDLRNKKYVPGKGKKENRRPASDKSQPRELSRGTIRGYYRVLRTILTAAGAESVCNKIGRLKGPKRKPNYLAPDDLARVLAHVRQHSPEWYPAVLLDAFAGLRWGELSSLKWEDIDETLGVIRVRRGNYRGSVVNSTKTGDDEDPNEKLVPLLPVVADVLRARRKSMVAVQHKGLVGGWIFPTVKGELHKGSPLRKVLDAACAASGARRITTHGLRHTANDLLRRVADGEVVRAITGHVTPEMTHHYSHVDEADKRAAIMKAFTFVLGTNATEGQAN